MIGRRGVFKALMAVPLAAKTAADAAIGNLAGIPIEGMGYRAYGGGMPASGQQQPHRFWEIAKKALSLPIPEWRIEQLRVECNHVTRLDVDIAALRSFSMSAKILMQRERDFAWRMDHAKNAHIRNAWREDFETKHGFWFW